MRYSILKDHIAKTVDRLKARPNPSEFTAGCVFELETVLAFINGMEAASDQSSPPSPSRTES
jgi:hypothetical protein